MLNSNQEKSRTRKRKILIEINGNPSPKPELYESKSILSLAHWEKPELFQNNRFIVQLENDDKNDGYIIPNSRIKKLSFRQDSIGKKQIVIESLISTDEWVEEFLEAKICHIYLLDARGEVLKYLDYDISSAGYEYELDYIGSSPFSPKFFYQIF